MRPTRNNFARQPRAFTVTELLVVIGILALLGGIITGMALRGRGQAERVRIQSDLQGIATALEAYRQDFGDYPRLPNAETFSFNADPSEFGDPNKKSGAELLCWALIGPYDASGGGGFNPDDGAPGPGFRQRGTRGQVYGPYLNIDTYKFGTDPNFSRYKFLKDYNGKAILYYAARTPRPGTGLFAGATKEFLYDFRDNGASFYRAQNLSDNDDALSRFRVAIGDTNHNGSIDTGETPFNQGPFLIWSPGQDMDYGPNDPTDANQVKQLDDIIVPGAQ